MQWRTLLIGSLAGVAAVWLVNRNRPMLTDGIRRVTEMPWSSWMRRFTQKPVEQVLNNVMN